MKNPLMVKSYRILCLKIMKKLGLLEIEWLKRLIKPLKSTLHRARLFVTVEEYMATALFTMMITTPFAFLLIHFAFVKPFITQSIQGLILTFVITIIYDFSLLLSFISYPRYRLDRMRESIDHHLPYATAHMATIAGSGIPLFKVFKIVGQFEEYGEVAEECKRISRNIEVFGYDTLTAISETAKSTPSSDFKDLLWGLVAIDRTGGDERDYLLEKADELLEKQETKQREFIDSLEVMAEMYTTIFVAGPILAIILITVMGTMGGLPFSLRSIFRLLIYVVLPILSIGFIVLLEGAKPTGGV